jgi:predicted PurR-regulated permease PerM
VGVVVGLVDTRQTWFWAIADGVVAVLVFLNLLVIVAVHGRRLRQSVRTRRAKRVRAQVESLLVELDPTWGPTIASGCADGFGSSTSSSVRSRR